MSIESKQKTSQKFNGNIVIENVDELVYINYNLNLALNKYLSEFGGSSRAKVKYWNDKLTEFINKIKINKNENPD